MQNNKVNKGVAELLKLLKQRLNSHQEPKVLPKPAQTQKRVKSAENQQQHNTEEMKVEEQKESQPELIDNKILDGNLSSYRTSNIEYGSYGEDSYFSDY